jgi:hypothetical protein
MYRSVGENDIFMGFKLFGRNLCLMDVTSELFTFKCLIYLDVLFF